MINSRAILVALLAMSLLSACGNMASLLQPNQNLADGIKSYENGDYKAALVSLQKAQNPDASSKSDQVKAHKYMAFIYCASGREDPCRSEFSRALKIDPSFDLTKAEVGHPVWGPVFRGEKAKFAK